MTADVRQKIISVASHASGRVRHTMTDQPLTTYIPTPASRTRLSVLQWLKRKISRNSQCQPEVMIHHERRAKHENFRPRFAVHRPSPNLP